MNPIKFGTDGWRGIIADDFTFDRVALVAPLAAQVLAQTGGNNASSGTVIVGYDRRFLAEDFALAAAKAVQNAGFDVLLSESYAPTPAFSLAAKQLNALGAIVLTASHNPGAYLGLKVKGGFGGSVSPEVTQQIEAKLENPAALSATPGKLENFNPWPAYCKTLREMVDIEAIKGAIASGKITVFVDVMHGAAAGGLAQILEETVQEVNSDRDPLFGGGAPEPLPRYLSQLFRVMRTHQRQILVPILIEHLAKRRGFTGEVIKTVSGSDIMPKIAELYGLPLFETPIGYKYIADRMLTTQVLVGGEESGGIGYGTHIPERDALLSALYLLEAVVKSGEDLSDIYRRLQTETNFTSAYDRIDLHLASMAERARLLSLLQNQPLTEIAGKAVVDCNKVDGYKFRLADGSWLLIRFSGTEPVLRLYSEAATLKEVMQNLNWAKSWAQN
ncbi:MAG: phosphoglucomutase/phosphomannomutase family protein [Oscillatoriales cyanobacterium]|nr:MAG: phosphoglucomutase/phosphomannomutase family protein [Oscillatoriales cyanobacterium]